MSALRKLVSTILADVLFPSDRPVINTMVKAVAHATPDVAEIIMRTMCLLQESAQLTSWSPKAEDLDQWFNVEDQSQLSLTSFKEPVTSANIPIESNAVSLNPSLPGTIDPQMLDFNLSQDFSAFGSPINGPCEDSWMQFISPEMQLNNAVMQDACIASPPIFMPSPPVTDFSPHITAATSHFDSDLMYQDSQQVDQPELWIDTGFFNFNPVLTTQSNDFSATVSPTTSPACVSAELQTPAASYTPSASYLSPASTTCEIAPQDYVWPSAESIVQHSEAHTAHIAALSMALISDPALLTRAEAHMHLIASKITKTSGQPVRSDPVDLTREDVDVKLLSGFLFADYSAIEVLLRPLETRILAVLEALGEAMRADVPAAITAPIPIANMATPRSAPKPTPVLQATDWNPKPAKPQTTTWAQRAALAHIGIPTIQEYRNTRPVSNVGQSRMLSTGYTNQPAILGSSLDTFMGAQSDQPFMAGGMGAELIARLNQLAQQGKGKKRKASGATVGGRVKKIRAT
ncbi:hypothetical protein ANO11243_052040 [Dothideomycetidae sp. 11243]|nr:hypothetical protein ANO11243_052040 [fungal sp. No.11243]